MGFFERRSVEEIRRDNAKLRAEKEVNLDMDRRNQERRALSNENFNLKHERKITAVKKIGSGMAWVGGGIASGINVIGSQYAKAHASKQPKRRVRRVKRVKRR